MPRRAPVSSWRPHYRPLIKLPDQGEGTRLSPAYFGIQARDRSWNAYADGFFNANQELIGSLNIQTMFQPGRTEVELVLKPGGVVGAVPLRSPDTCKIVGGIVVEPRFGWDNIGSLLSTIGWSASPELLRYPLVPGSAREVPPWVLAGPILQRIASLLRETVRGFRLHEEVRQTPRGTILWKRYCTEQVNHGAYHMLPCRFPELGPDQLLRACLRWGLERVRASLGSYAQTDVIARRLCEDADVMLLDLRDIPSRTPDHRTLNQMLASTMIPSAVLKAGLEALGWIVDERGLGGRVETDGLAWRLPMHYLFERWVEHLVRVWAREFGGRVSTARTGDALFPIRWDQPGTGSLNSLAPDVVLQAGDTTYIFDAKYKGLFEELDESRWREVSEELKNEHRHDLHQVLAYSALFDSPRVVSVLVYPMQPGTWSSAGLRSLARAMLTSSQRQVEIVLTGVPLRLAAGLQSIDIVRRWDGIHTAHVE